MDMGFSDVIALISLIGSAFAFSRTIRHRPEASWVNLNILTNEPNATPPLADENGRAPKRLSMLANDGDGPAFDVRVFGHDCIVRAYAWERLDHAWKIGEQTMMLRVDNDEDDVKLAIWPPEGMDDFPEDAMLCIHWVKSPTRLRRCGYATIPLKNMADKWWEERDWQLRHRLSERFKEWREHRRFHRHPEDAKNAPLPII